MDVLATETLYQFIFFFILFSAKHYLDYIGIIPVVVMEFIDRGCLRSFLNDFKKASSPDPIGTKRNFVLYGKQIAEGMNYLVRTLSKV